MHCGRVKWLHRSNLAREPLCKEHWYRLKSGDNTYHCRSPTTKLNDKTCLNFFGMLPGFLENCWSGNLFCSATAATKTALGIIQLWFNYFRGIMAYTFSRRLSRDAAVVDSFTPASLYVYWDDQFANLSVPFQNAMPLDTQPTGVLSSPNSLLNFSEI